MGGCFQRLWRLGKKFSLGRQVRKEFLFARSQSEHVKYLKCDLEIWSPDIQRKEVKSSSSSSIGLEELMGRIESPETDQNILENLTKSGQSGLYDKWY